MLRKLLFILTGIYLLVRHHLNLERAGEKMQKAHQFKNAMRVYAAELICSTGVLGFQTFKPVFRMYDN